MTMLRKNYFLVAAFASLVASGVFLTGQQPAGGPFTAEQASAGKAAYEASCAACHGSDLMGAPPLAGEGFVGGWRTRTTRDLYGLIQTTMPADNPGGLSETTYVNIVAYILQFNGITAGTTPLTADDRSQDRWSMLPRRLRRQHQPARRRSSPRRCANSRQQDAARVRRVRLQVRDEDADRNRRRQGSRFAVR